MSKNGNYSSTHIYLFMQFKRMPCFLSAQISPLVILRSAENMWRRHLSASFFLREVVLSSCDAEIFCRAEVTVIRPFPQGSAGVPGQPGEPGKEGKRVSKQKQFSSRVAWLVVVARKGPTAAEGLLLF